MNKKAQASTDDPKVTQLKEQLPANLTISDDKIKKLTEHFPDNYQEVGQMLSKQNKVFKNLNNKACELSADVVCQLESPKDIKAFCQKIEHHSKNLNKVFEDQRDKYHDKLDDLENCQSKLHKYRKQLSDQNNFLPHTTPDIRKSLDEHRPDNQAAPEAQQSLEEKQDNKPANK